MVPSPTKTIFEYCAAFSFMIAFTVTRAGITSRAPDPRWLRESLTGAGKDIAGLTGIAVLTGLVELNGHEAVDILKAVVKTIFTAFVFVVVVGLLYQYGTKKKAKTTKKKQPSRKRPVGGKFSFELTSSPSSHIDNDICYMLYTKRYEKKHFSTAARTPPDIELILHKIQLQNARGASKKHLRNARRRKERFLLHNA